MVASGAANPVCNTAESKASRDVGGEENAYTTEDYTAYYATAQSVQGRLGLARAAGLGVGLWRLGDEDQETWNIPALTP